ncbi:MAG: methyltransferase [Pedosphaera sp.]|nr:methyltransferase [Pedosphaera sp.]
MIGVLFDEAKKIARNPKRLGQAFHLRRWRQLFGILRFNARTRNRWSPLANARQLQQREYSSYDQYVRHQASKFAHLDLAEYDRTYREQLRERLRGQPGIRPAAAVLCLGARQGTEVKAFLDLGCFAVGIDLNPGRDNKYVLPGDFHDVQFPAATMDIIFTNSFDHTFDPKKLIGEITRLLKPGGVLIIEAIQGEADNIAPDHYASFWWQKIDDLVALLAQHNFKPLRRHPFTQPWPGEQICFTVDSAK